MTVSREAFVSSVRRCVGTKVGHQGRVIGSKLDCAGVVVASLKDAGGPTIVTPSYGNPPSGGDMLRVLQEVATPVSREDKPGDLWVGLWKGEPRHVAVYVGDDRYGRRVCVRADGDRGFVLKEELPRVFRVVQKWTLKAVED
jgi:catechol 2,3-dioxygenase-like lactoylglutathione lyase family enzyme